MKYTLEHLNLAVKNNIFSEEQKNKFVSFIKDKNDTINPLQKFLFYAGALLIISALSWLLGDSWIRLGHEELLLISSIYFVVFTAAGTAVRKKIEMELLGNLLFCISIAVVPLIVYSIMRLLHFWPDDTYRGFYIWIRGKWVILEIVTIVIALLFLLKIKFHFIVFLISFCLWYLSMDIVPIIYRKNLITWTERGHISELFGTVMIAIGYFLQLKKHKDYAFWLYLFGLITLTLGSSIFYNDNKSALAVLLVIHIFMCLFSLFLSEPVFMVFGVIGIGEFLARISYIYFEESILFPFMLTFIGIGIISLGIMYQKNRAHISSAVDKIFSGTLKKFRPEN